MSNLCNSDTFKDFIANCTEAITVYAQLEPSTTYTWVITDKFSNAYQGDFTTDVDGFFSIDVDDLPPGLLTQFSGSFVLTVQGSGCKPVNFKIAQEYDSILFNIKAGNLVKASLGCPFTCTGNTGAENLLLPFEDQALVTIDWTGYADAYGNNPLVQVYHLLSGPYDLPNSYELVTVNITQERLNGVLQEIVVDNGGPATGYVLISNR